ncbi:MAG: 3-hydroxyacyl-ACP dehydratase FabZ [Gammaproteobacteria bacterium]
MIMDIKEVLSLLPHRYPFLLIDKVLKFEPFQSLVAVKNVTINEPFFVGHFPGEPVMPGVLILEALAQASGIIILKSDPTIKHEENLFLLVGVDNVRFKRMVVPGDVLQLNVELIRHKQNIYKFQGTGTVNGEVVCSAELMNARRSKSD